MWLVRPPYTPRAAVLKFCAFSSAFAGFFFVHSVAARPSVPHHILMYTVQRGLWCLDNMLFVITESRTDFIVVVYMPSRMVYSFTEPLTYCELEETRRRYLTVQAPRGRTNRVCWRIIRTITLCWGVEDSRCNHWQAPRRAGTQGFGRE